MHLHLPLEKVPISCFIEFHHSKDEGASPFFPSRHVLIRQKDKSLPRACCSPSFKSLHSHMRQFVRVQLCSLFHLYVPTPALHRGCLKIGFKYNSDLESAQKLSRSTTAFIRCQQKSFMCNIKKLKGSFSIYTKYRKSSLWTESANGPNIQCQKNHPYVYRVPMAQVCSANKNHSYIYKECEWPKHIHMYRVCEWPKHTVPTDHTYTQGRILVGTKPGHGPSFSLFFFEDLVRTWLNKERWPTDLAIGPPLTRSWFCFTLHHCIYGECQTWLVLW